MDCINQGHFYDLFYDFQFNVVILKSTKTNKCTVYFFRDKLSYMILS